MKSMAFRCLVLLSALLSLAAAAAWVMSYASPLPWTTSLAQHDSQWQRLDPRRFGLPPDVPDIFYGPVRETPSGAMGRCRTWWVRSSRGGLTFVFHNARSEDGTIVFAGPDSGGMIGTFDLFSTGVPTQVSLNGNERFRCLGSAYSHASIVTPVPGNRLRIIPVYDSRRYSISMITIPYWLLAVLGLPLPILAWRRARRGRRWASQGRCAHCGYDLRASPQRCPECGAMSRQVERLARAKPGRRAVAFSLSVNC